MSWLYSTSKELAQALSGVKPEPRVTWWMRWLGVRWSNGQHSWKMRWGEFSARPGFTLNYSVYHEDAHLTILLGWGAFYITMPMLIEQRDGTEDWNACFGVSYFNRTFHLNWRDKCKVIYLPWDWTHVRHSYLYADGSVHHHAGKIGDYRPPPETCEMHAYTYVLRDGTRQDRIATVNGEEREWRWRWLTWVPWPCRVKRSINVEFDAEVGERSGSWKGGATGCGYDWLPGETLEYALRRMERERTFT